ITGPFNVTGPGDTPSRRRIFTCRPGARVAEAACAKTIISTLARRAYRRPVTDADVQPLLAFYNAGRQEGGFETGIERALQVILPGPKFVFRVEHDQPDAAPGRAARVSDVELASRLSFFLWSGPPDEELLSKAETGALSQPETL